MSGMVCPSAEPWSSSVETYCVPPVWMLAEVSSSACFCTGAAAAVDRRRSGTTATGCRTRHHRHGRRAGTGFDRLGDETGHQRRPGRRTTHTGQRRGPHQPGAHASTRTACQRMVRHWTGADQAHLRTVVGAETAPHLAEDLGDLLERLAHLLYGLRHHLAERLG